jgi:hypothetical protein
MLKSRVPSVDRNFNPTGENSAYTNNGRNTYTSRGMSWFPGYAIDIDRGIRLNMMFSENIQLSGARGNDLKYDFPITNGTGNIANQNYVYVLDQPYDKCRQMEIRFDTIGYTYRFSNQGVLLGTAIANQIYGEVMYAGYPGIRESSVPKNLRDPLGITADAKNLNNKALPFGNQAKVAIRVNRSFAYYKGVPTYTFDTEGLETKFTETIVAQNALNLIRAVPNPYNAFSNYEVSQTDNRMKIINLPNKCDISIFTINGTLIRTFSVDLKSVVGSNVINSIDWNLTNQNGLPISSGAYIIHIDAKELGTKTIKWFCITRPLDVEGINQN